MKLVRALLLITVLFAAPAVHAAEGDTHFAVSGPLTLVDGSGFWGANGTIYYEITPRWWLGGNTGFFYWHKSYVGATSSAWFIPIVPTVLYNLNAVTSTFHPYIGAGLGVAYKHNTYSPASAVDITDSGVKFEGLAHVGARFGRARRFFADIGFGDLDGDFVFAPQIGWLFSL